MIIGRRHREEFDLAQAELEGRAFTTSTAVKRRTNERLAALGDGREWCAAILCGGTELVGDGVTSGGRHSVDDAVPEGRDILVAAAIVGRPVEESIACLNRRRLRVRRGRVVVREVDDAGCRAGWRESEQSPAAFGPALGDQAVEVAIGPWASASRSTWRLSVAGSNACSKVNDLDVVILKSVSSWSAPPLAVKP